uniref:Uncharacterized protein n=1 Tax=Physcomitrium patens TaxID=3218 RepID=A0A2K1KHD8_PHYPA|nr:hypothetical protein PHYPA_009563 [Physcomitrium patens]
MPFRLSRLSITESHYPISSGLAEACRLNIEAYMVKKLCIAPAIVTALCGALYRNYGTTMAGLWAEGYYFDHDDYHEYVHGRLPWHNLHPYPFIFTNADKIHADKVLNLLGLEDIFEGFLCFESFNCHSAISKDRQVCQDADDDVDVKLDTSVLIVCKPAIACFQEAIQLMQLDPSKTLFFDDSARNILGGKRLNCRRIHNLKESIPEIWSQPRFIEPLQISHEIAVATVA